MASKFQNWSKIIIKILFILQERLGWDPLQRYISDLNHY